MIPPRIFLGLPVAAALGLVLGQGCALFTCVEDDCDSLSGGSAPGTGGAGGSIGVTSTDASASSTTANGGGGAGGGSAVTCTDALGGDTSSVAIAGSEVWVITDGGIGDTVVSIDATTMAPGSTVNPMGDAGRLAVLQNDVLHASGEAFYTVTGTADCDKPTAVITDVDATDDRLVVLANDTLELRNLTCVQVSPRPAPGATAVRTSGDVILYDALLLSLPPRQGPCFDPVARIAPVCHHEIDVRGIALMPGGQRAFYRTASGIHGLDLALEASDYLAFGRDEKPAPMAASSTHLFFVTNNEPSGPALWRCPVDDASACTSIQTGEIRGLAPSLGSVYFSEGQRLCRWVDE